MTARRRPAEESATTDHRSEAPANVEDQQDETTREEVASDDLQPVSDSMPDRSPDDEVQESETLDTVEVSAEAIANEAKHSGEQPVAAEDMAGQDSPIATSVAIVPGRGSTNLADAGGGSSPAVTVAPASGEVLEEHADLTAASVSAEEVSRPVHDTASSDGSMVAEATEEVGDPPSETLDDASTASRTDLATAQKGANSGQPAAPAYGLRSKAASSAAPEHSPVEAKTGESKEHGTQSPTEPKPQATPDALNPPVESVELEGEGEANTDRVTDTTAAALREKPANASHHFQSLLERSTASAARRGEHSEPRDTIGSRVDPARFVNRVARAFTAAEQRGGTLQLRLSPPELGAMKIELNMQQGGLTARLETETAAAKNVLLDNLPALRDRLAAQDIRVDKFEVDVRQQGSGGEPDWQAQQDRRRDQGSQPQRSNHAATTAGAVGTATGSVERKTHHDGQFSAVA